MHISPGVLQGFYKCENGCDHDMLVVGSPIELTMLLRTMHLGPDTDAKFSQDENTGVTTISNEAGTYLTLRPADTATDLLAHHIGQAMGGGDFPF